ncbi:gluconolactonase [Neolewinella xylanilytica]|uniref:Gluconolactonase n=1 Tax=Neolewinella xylanilytica TaxID=1514080 RepID=A0A2S6I3S0_9BACT|nr:SMP-30/gluconolactonase/LRE family protein [Neolewinella xylanilytica]PPK85813.1 gluconolactonase [Neolewinella xylanilytica]
MKDTYFIPCDAHEGCVWVASQHRLYFSTTKKLEETRVDLMYLDFSAFDLARDGDWSARLDRQSVQGLEAQTWIRDANMANSLCLTNDGLALLVAEQGSQERAACISRIEFADRQRTVVFDQYGGMPLNSPNKVIQSRVGHVIVSDPDYGFRQGFRPPPSLEPQLYVLPKNGDPVAYRGELEMPHGLALSPDERTLFVTDTSDDGAHDAVDLDRRHRVYALDFDPAKGTILGNHRYAFSTDEGVPDGSQTTEDSLLVGGGDGVYVADLDGQLRGKIKLDRTAVNLAVVYDHLFVTADEGVYLILNWKQRVG